MIGLHPSHLVEYCNKFNCFNQRFFFLQILRGAPTVEGRPGEHLEPLNFNNLKEELEEKHGIPMSDKDVISSALYPKVFDDFVEFRDIFGPVDKLDTKTFLVGPEIAEETTVSTDTSVRL